MAVNRAVEPFGRFVFENVISRDGDVQSSVLDEAVLRLFPNESVDERTQRRRACTDKPAGWLGFPYDISLTHRSVKFLKVVSPATESKRMVAGESDAKRLTYQVSFVRSLKVKDRFV